MIDLSEIQQGDPIMISDRQGHRVRTTAQRLPMVLQVAIFGRRIDVARRDAAGWHHVDGIRVLEHQPELRFEADR